MTKKCNKCLIEKPVEEFYTYKTGKRIGKPLYYCKLCGVKLRSEPAYKLKRKKFRKTPLSQLQRVF